MVYSNTKVSLEEMSIVHVKGIDFFFLLLQRDSYFALYYRHG